MAFGRVGVRNCQIVIVVVVVRVLEEAVLT
jgi:hypothetical protein